MHVCRVCFYTAEPLLEGTIGTRLSGSVGGHFSSAQGGHLNWPSLLLEVMELLGTTQGKLAAVQRAVPTWGFSLGVVPSVPWPLLGCHLREDHFPPNSDCTVISEVGDSWQFLGRLVLHEWPLRPSHPTPTHRKELWGSRTESSQSKQPRKARSEREPSQSRRWCDLNRNWKDGGFGC